MPTSESPNSSPSSTTTATVLDVQGGTLELSDGSVRSIQSWENLRALADEKLKKEDRWLTKSQKEDLRKLTQNYIKRDQKALKQAQIEAANTLLPFVMADTVAMAIRANDGSILEDIEFLYEIMRDDSLDKNTRMRARKERADLILQSLKLSGIITEKDRSVSFDEDEDGNRSARARVSDRAISVADGFLESLDADLDESQLPVRVSDESVIETGTGATNASDSTST